MEKPGLGWPRTAHTVPRTRIVEQFYRLRPSVLLMCAPSGYGKSVAAAQLGMSGFERRIWLDLGGRSPDSESLVEEILGALGDRGGGGCPELGLIPSADESDLWLSVEHALPRSEATLLVLDGLHTLVGLDAVAQLARRIKRVCGETSALVVTCRDVEGASTSGPDEFWILDSEDLSLALTELCDLVACTTGDRPSESVLTALAEISRGHAATAAVVSRHVADASAVEAPNRWKSLDLQAYLLGTAQRCLSERQKTVLAAAALLGSGSADDLRLVLGFECMPELEELSRSLPLVVTSVDDSGLLRFNVHEIAATAYSSASFVSGLGSGRDLLAMAKKHLAVSGDYDRLLAVAYGTDTRDAYADVLEGIGASLLAHGRVALLRSAMSRLRLSELTSRPLLLLTRGKLERLAGHPDQALRTAAAVRDLCRCVDNDAILAEAQLLQARALLDMGKHGEVADILAGFQSHSRLLESPALDAVYNGYMVVGLAQEGDEKGALRHASELQRIHETADLNAEVRAHTSFCYLWLLGPNQGRWAEVVPLLERSACDERLSIWTRLQTLSNLAWCLVQVGRLDRARRVAGEAESIMRDSDLNWVEHNLGGTRGSILLGEGDVDRAQAEVRRASEVCEEASDGVSAVWSRLTMAVLLRSRGQHGAALSEAEDAVARLSTQTKSEHSIWMCWARIEVAASLCALNDLPAARETCEECGPSVGALHNQLRLALVLAEIERRSGSGIRAVTSLVNPHRNYIRSQSANWELAMYIRAFPGLLGPVAAVVGVDELPSHMLQMILPEYAQKALPLARDYLSADDWRRLAVRLLGDEAARLLEASFTSEPLVRVRTFGGLEVTTPDGVVSDKAWRKRKARALFMMLITKQGTDVPRDIFFDVLWPDMDLDRAKSNFYVIWSTMKDALMFGVKGRPCPYVEHVGGVCRIVRSLVRSDLDDFDDACLAFHAAEDEGDLKKAAAQARAIRDIYRGEMLPSELYEDWFRAMRERYRVQHGDVMLRMARMCRDAGEPEQALGWVRAGLEHDPWREDLYQSAIRCQIDVGQRSGAVDMYMACRSRLAEDLGLDPSVETRRLYEEVLAMEERG